MNLIQTILARLEKAEERKIYAKQYTPEEIQQLSEITKATAEDAYVIRHGNKKVVVDNENGLGQVPWNQEVMYSGCIAFMSATSYLKLALNDEGLKDGAATSIVKLLEQNYSIGNPFLQIDMREDPFVVEGHEGRARTKAMVKYFGGDFLMPVHIIMYGQKRRNLTPEMIKKLKAGDVSPQEREGVTIGPGHIKEVI